jgi:hypothetical protein
MLETRWKVNYKYSLINFFLPKLLNQVVSILSSFIFLMYKLADENYWDRIQSKLNFKDRFGDCFKNSLDIAEARSLYDSFVSFIIIDQ